MIETRYAQKDDLPLVYAMYIAGLEEHPEYNAINEEKCLDVVLKAWATAPAVLLVKDNEIIGFAGLKTLVLEYSDMVVLREYFFYIQPPHRSPRAARTLSKAVQEVAETFKIPIIFSHMLGVDHVEKRAKMLRKWGYTVTGLEVRYGW